MAEVARHNAMIRLGTEVARLDGFLSGVASLCGEIRDYAAFSYVIELKEGQRSIEESLKDYFEWLPTLGFADTKVLAGGLRDLEIAIRPFLVRETSSVNSADLLDLRRYLSFRVMEMISNALNGSGIDEVVELFADSSPSDPKSAFFCVCAERTALILQFNSNIEFKRKQGSEPA